MKSKSSCRIGWTDFTLIWCLPGNKSKKFSSKSTPILDENTQKFRTNRRVSISITPSVPVESFPMKRSVISAFSAFLYGEEMAENVLLLAIPFAVFQSKRMTWLNCSFFLFNGSTQMVVVEFPLTSIDRVLHSIFFPDKSKMV